ncbi:ABC transporter permease [Haloquadratum walsbyi]|jgi:ABC-type nitrate/sulfonate/bicarbonate transport system, permease component|uniref:ABC-type nitrate/sulfonate/bicarbonate transport system, permease component n=1 Tax=Haloquadratum walsbyi J07HQW2 TaxID=1238425 RepID=U1PQ53_9EURY|nr:ABC transporter permease subunit [Haloquadratum walsbyi]ERG94441.1 MAG: ABC-type nitrate/sulfonate/bicarbonate transport system, permease component [Haloquadratum walsbyi J07HQW2]
MAILGDKHSTPSLKPVVRWVVRILAASLAIAGWHGLVLTQNILLASPGAVAEAFVTDMFLTRVLSEAILIALRNAIAGYAIALVIGIPTGVLIGLSSPVRHVLDPALDALYSTPMVALAPLFIILFGLSPIGKITLVVTFAVFVIIINTKAGLADTPQGLLDAAAVYSGNSQFTGIRVRIRYALPSILTGARLGAGRAIRGAVAAELFLYADALGQYLIDSGAAFETDRLLAGVIALMLVGILAVESVRAVEARVRYSS